LLASNLGDLQGVRDRTRESRNKRADKAGFGAVAQEQEVFARGKEALAAKLDVEIASERKNIELTFKPGEGLANSIADLLADKVKAFVEANQKAIEERMREKLQNDIKAAVEKNNQLNQAAQNAKNAQG
jgi:ABC-type phosphate transport system ATPase subunit